MLVLVQLSKQQGVDQTRVAEASGSDVVRAVVNRIQNVFGNGDRQFLRRVAFVESRDGTDANTYRSGYHGGIWQVDRAAFLGTQDTSSHFRLLANFNKIREAFGIDWPSVQWNELRMPLYSGIAARLFLLNNPLEIPGDIPGQANYWNRFYNQEEAGTVEKFIEDVAALRRMEGSDNLLHSSA